jgi:hypothetical protein
MAVPDTMALRGGCGSRPRGRVVVDFVALTDGLGDCDGGSSGVVDGDFGVGGTEEGDGEDFFGAKDVGVAEDKVVAVAECELHVWGLEATDGASVKGGHRNGLLGDEDVLEGEIVLGHHVLSHDFGVDEDEEGADVVLLGDCEGDVLRLAVHVPQVVHLAWRTVFACIELDPSHTLGEVGLCVGLVNALALEDVALARAVVDDGHGSSGRVDESVDGCPQTLKDLRFLFSTTLYSFFGSVGELQPRVD